MNTSQLHRLNVADADVQFYRDHGYFVYGYPLFPSEKFRRLQAFFEGLLADLPEGKRPRVVLLGQLDV